ncbi:hypothetical protein [Aporhodopirellula aestuarii]
MLFACVTAVTVGAAPSASACCLTDWLYGRQPAYAVAPAVVPAPVPITTGQPVSPYAASYTPYTAGYTPLVTAAAPNSTVLPLAGRSIYSPSPYAVQRPAYGAVPLDNPSVYTGQPIIAGYRGVASAGSSIYGTGNLYPNNYASASPSVVGQPVTSYRPDLNSTVALPVNRVYPTPVRSGLARFFNSLLGTGYRTSYYTAPITYYRPATTLDPVTGTTVTVQQPCTSTVQQLQRTPYATLQPAPLSGATAMGSSSFGINPATGIDACSAQAPYDPTGSLYGASPIPSTTTPGGLSPIGGYDSNGFNSAPTSGLNGSGDLQPVSPPTLPSTSTFSARPNYSSPSYTAPSYSAPVYSEPSYSSPSYSDPGYSGSGNADTNVSPLTGSSQTYRQEFDADREPFPAPSISSARPSSEEVDSKAADEAWRQGYEAGRAALQKEAESKRESQYSPYSAPENSSDPYGDSNGSNDDRETDQSTPNSYYQLNPPANTRPSTDEADDAERRTRWQRERDEQDLRELTTGIQRSRYGSQFVTGTEQSAPRVRPIPAPEDYRNPFETTERLKAPDLLPALPPPTTQFNRGVERSSGYSNEQRLSVPVREASVQGPQDRVPTRSYSENRAVISQPAAEPAPRANAWQNKIRSQAQESGWYAKDR